MWIRLTDAHGTREMPLIDYLALPPSEVAHTHAELFDGPDSARLAVYADDEETGGGLVRFASVMTRRG